MIFRDKFVSNSSSSSFIVHKLDIGEDKFNKLSNLAAFSFGQLLISSIAK